MLNVEPILGRYLNITIDGVEYRPLFSKGRRGIPLLCLHTAGADGLSIDTCSTILDHRAISRHRVRYALSRPARILPTAWWLREVSTQDREYLAIIRAVWKALELIVRWSWMLMGGAIVLKIAANTRRSCRDHWESESFRPGRYNDYCAPAGNPRWRLAASYTYGLCRPQSPEASKREKLVVLQPVGPGRIRRRPCIFYSIDWDGREDIKRIERSLCKGRC